MENVTSLVSMKAPEGLIEWEPVQEALDVHGLIYEAVWTTDCSLDAMLDDRARGRKVKAVKVRCSFCGHEELLPWCKMDEHYGGYGFIHPGDERNTGGPCGSGEETLCPFCHVPVKVKKAAELGRYGHFESDEAYVMSASVVGKANYLALTCWDIVRQVHRDGHETYKAKAAEAYVFSPGDCAKLTGWVNSYSGNAGYFVSYKTHWGQPQRWSESWGEVSEKIYGLTPELVARSCMPNCKLDVYMDTFRHEMHKYPVAYLRLYQHHPNVENLLVSGLPMVLDELLEEEMPNYKWEKNCRGLPSVDEINWEEARPAQMLGLNKEELRMAREQGWGVLFWRLYLGAKEHGELLTRDDIQNAFCYGDEDVMDLVGKGPVGKSLRYLLEQIEMANNDPEVDVYVDMGDYISVHELLDYWEMAKRCGRDLNDPRVRWPRDLQGAHDIVSGMARDLERKSLPEKFRKRRKELAKYILEQDGLRIIPAGSQKDLDNEADKLDHCVWQYGEGHANGRYAIFFIRKSSEPKKPYYTLQLNEDKLEVMQNRGYHNCDKTPEVQSFEDLWISWLRDGAKRDEKGRPLLPKKKKEVKIA